MHRKIEAFSNKLRLSVSINPPLNIRRIPSDNISIIIPANVERIFFFVSLRGILYNIGRLFLYFKERIFDFNIENILNFNIQRI